MSGLSSTPVQRPEQRPPEPDRQGLHTLSAALGKAQSGDEGHFISLSAACARATSLITRPSSRGNDALPFYEKHGLEIEAMFTESQRGILRHSAEAKTLQSSTPALKNSGRICPNAPGPAITKAPARDIATWEGGRLKQDKPSKITPKPYAKKSNHTKKVPEEYLSSGRSL